MTLPEDYPVGARLILVGRGEYPVEVTGHTSLSCDLVVRWLGLRPLGALSAVDGQSTVCTHVLREIRRA